MAWLISTQCASGVAFMSGGITYDGHTSMLGITELELGSSENSYSRARKRSVIVVLEVSGCHNKLLHCVWAKAKSGNLFRTGARWDFPEQLAGRSYKRKPKMRTAYYYNICIANQWDGWCCLPWRRISMSGSMDELDKSRMSFRWRSERRERRRDFVYFILEKSCSQQ